MGWAQGDPKDPQGAQGYLRAPSAPLGGIGHGAPWGYTEAIPNGTPFRLDGYYETIPKLKPWLESRLNGKVSSGWPWVRNNAQVVQGQQATLTWNCVKRITWSDITQDCEPLTSPTRSGGAKMTTELYRKILRKCKESPRKFANHERRMPFATTARNAATHTLRAIIQHC